MVSAHTRLRVEGSVLQDSTTVSAVVDGKRIAYVNYNVCCSYIIINYVDVEEESRRLGYGSMLVMEALRDAEGRGLSLYTGRLTTPGRRLIEAMRDKGMIELKDLGLDIVSYEIVRAHGGKQPWQIGSL